MRCRLRMGDDIKSKIERVCYGNRGSKDFSIKCLGASTIKGKQMMKMPRVEAEMRYRKNV
jgi:hypothetical protein